MKIEKNGIRKFAQLTIASLIGSFFALSPIVPSSATGLVITYNNGVCDLSTSSPNVFTVANADQLWEITDCSGSGDRTFELAQHITVSDAVSAPTTSPIGFSSSNSIFAFRGTLDGNGYSINGLSMTSSNSGVGLFALLEGAEVRDLTIHGSFVTQVTTTTKTSAAGALAINATGNTTVSGVTNYASVTGRSYVSGLIGMTEGNYFISATNSGSITAFDYAGGLVGYSSGSAAITSQVIDQSRNSGTVSASAGNSYAGGLVGFHNRLLRMTASENSGSVSGAGNYAGGLIGGSSAPLTVISSINLGRVVGGGWYTGGLVAYSTLQVVISSSSNVGNIQGGSARTGGLVGQVQGSISISNSLNEAAVAGGSQTGGLVGISFGNVEVVGSTNSGSVVGQSSVAGFVAEATGTSNLRILNSTNTASISPKSGATSPSGYGGFVGQASALLQIRGGKNTGLVSSSATAGGFVGETYGLLDVAESKNSGEINTTLDKAGGIVGVARASSFSQVLNYGSVRARSFAGGIVGFQDSLTSTLSQVANTANISGDSQIGGLVGSLKAGSKFMVTDAHNSGTVSANISSAGGFLGAGAATSGFFLTRGLQNGSVNSDVSFEAWVGNSGSVSLTNSFTNQAPASWSARSDDATLRTASTYVGWDFTNVWGFLGCDVNNGFPVLRFAYSGETFSSTGCITADSGSPPSGSPTNTPAPSYTGPTANKLAYPVTAGTSATFTGSKLDQVSSAMFGTTAVIISSQTSGSLTVVVPSSLGAATYDLVLFSSFGTLTVMQAVTVRTATATVDSKPAELVAWNWVPRFLGNSRSLSKAQAQELETTVNKYPAATTVICWGYTTSTTPNAWAIAHATARAKAACDLLTTTNPKLRTVVRVRFGVEKTYAMRSALQFWK